MKSEFVILLSLLGGTSVGCLAADESLPPVPIPAPAQVSPPMAQPPVDPGPQLGADLTVAVEAVLEGQIDFVTPLNRGALVVQSAGMVKYGASIGASLVDVGAEPGAVVSAAALEWGTVVIAGENGFYVYAQGTLSPSPLSTAVDVTKVQSVLATPGPEGPFDVWLALDDSLHLWRKGQSFAIQPGVLPVAGAQMAFGAPVDGKPATWIASGGAVYALVWETDQFVAYQSRATTPVDAIAVDFEGTLWIASEGKLLSRGFDGKWHGHAEVTDVEDVSASPDAVDLWIRTKNGLFHHKGGTIRPVGSAPAGITRLFSADGGAALIVTATGLYRVLPGRSIAVAGIDDGGLLQMVATVTIQPDAPDHVNSVTVSLDGAPVDLMGTEWSVQVDPAPLSDGTHALEIKVTYDDGTPDSARTVRFSVFHQRPPTWTDDIEPLFELRCEVCHGLRGSARKLDTSALWSSDFDRIVAAINDGRMPLPPNNPVTPEELELLEGWRAAGFME